MDIPIKFRRAVCMCADPVVDHGHEHRFLVWCKNCYKPMRWQLRKCSNCTEWYIRDFQDVNNCKYVRHQRCWECLHIDGTSRCDGNLCIPEKYSSSPIGLNPREITMSEEEADEILRRHGIST
jgi:hypothetical protein